MPYIKTQQGVILSTDHAGQTTTIIYWPNAPLNELSNPGQVALRYISLAHGIQTAEPLLIAAHMTRPLAGHILINWPCACDLWHISGPHITNPESLTEIWQLSNGQSINFDKTTANWR